MRCFVDTSAFLAVLDRSDECHDRARDLWKRLLGDGANELASTNYVILETVALVQRRLGLSALRSFATDVVPVLDLIWVDRELHDRGMALLASQSRRGLSLVDCTSFLVMRQLGLEDYFAFDRDFADQGFKGIQ